MEQHQAIGRALALSWQQKDLSLLRDQLAEKLTWFEDAFMPPLFSPDAVIAQWKKDLSAQTNITATIELLDVVANRGYHHCDAQWDDVRAQHHVIDALFVIHLNDAGKIVYFMPWYTSKTQLR